MLDGLTDGLVPSEGIPEGFDTPSLLQRRSETHAESPIGDASFESRDGNRTSTGRSRAER